MTTLNNPTQLLYVPWVLECKVNSNEASMYEVSNSAEGENFKEIGIKVLFFFLPIMLPPPWYKGRS